MENEKVIVLLFAILVYPCHSGGDTFAIEDDKGIEFVAFVLSKNPAPRPPFKVMPLHSTPKKNEVITRVIVSSNGVHYVHDYINPELVAVPIPPFTETKRCARL